MATRQQLQQQLQIPEAAVSKARSSAPSYWRLDTRTIERGKAGVRAAREALREAEARRAQSHPHAA